MAATRSRKVSKSAILAGAALTAPIAANADIVFNSTPVIISANSTDATFTLNLDGVDSFLFTASLVHSTDSVTPLGSNGYVGTATNNPTPLSVGTLIGPGSTFQTGTGVLQFTGKLIQKGPWPAHPNLFAYLGIEFYVGTDLHYGWVNLSACTPDITTNCSSTADPSVIELTSAYETIAGTPIKAGATSEVPEPSLLPLLALGAAGLGAFRARRKRAA